MLEHVAARCGEFRLLIPAENVAHIEPVAPGATFAPWTERDRLSRSSPLLDLRRLLEARGGVDKASRVRLRWQANDRRFGIDVLVDAADAIVDCRQADLVDARLLPARLRPLCSQVVPDEGGLVRLRVKPDVVLAMPGRRERRRFVDALVFEEGGDGR